MRRPLLALLAALSLVACHRQEGPADTYLRFAATVRAGKADRAWAMLSRRSQAMLDARARAVAAKAPPGVVPASGQDLVLGDLALASPKVKSAVVVRESGKAAVVAVEDEAGRRAEVTLVKDDGAWRVELPGAGG